jgi:hypothetical protein
MIKNSLKSLLFYTGALAVMFFGYVLVEPAIGFGAASQFTISQSVTAELSFSTPASSIVLSPSIGGLTGGAATGSTQVIVSTSNHLGYLMTIQASSSNGMVGNSNGSNYIPAYEPSVAGIPDYNFILPANRAYFGYTVQASSSADASSYFKNNGSACNTGATNDGHCWINASSTPFTIVSTSAATPGSGSTTTLTFHVGIAANPSPSVPDDTYVATTTLTAVAK